MALVAYGNSSGEESGSEDESPPKITEASSTNTKQALETRTVTTGLFSLLPEPKSKTATVYEDDIKDVPVLGPQPKKTVKISIPSLTKFADDDDDDEVQQKKKFKPSPVGSGLLGMLPKPQNLNIKEACRQLTPHVLKRTVPVKKPVSRPVQKKQTTAKEENNSDDEEVTDFFSLDSKDPDPVLVDAPIETVVAKPFIAPKAFDIAAPVSEFSYPGSSSQQISASQSTYYPVSGQQNSEAAASSTTDIAGIQVQQYQNTRLPQDLINDQGFLRMKGRVREEINIIDIDGAEQMPRPEEWLKTISMEQSRPSHKKGTMPNSQSRRKHQITYLAYQAKERELELKNQWAMNRMTKKQTQAKYGF